MALNKFFRFPFAVTGDKAAVPDDTQLSGDVSFEQGYGPDYSRDPATDPLAKNIERDKMNQLFFDVTTALREYQIMGTPDFITSAQNGGAPYSYDQNAIVKYSGALYISLVSSNTALPSDATKWALLPTPALLQQSAYISADAGGTVNAITAAFTPAIVALPSAPGTISVLVRAAGANTSSAPTFKADGITAKTIVKGNNVPLLAGDIAGAGHWLELQYDPSLDKWVLQNPTNSFGGTPPQFDNTAKLATTEFVQRALGNMASAKIVNATGNILAEDAGTFIEILGTSGNITLTLPDISTVPAGTTFELYNNAGFGCTIQRSGSATIADRSGVAQTSYTLRIQSTARFISDGFNWFLTSGFGGHLPASNGYQRLPNGIIIQWMQFAKTTTASPISNSWPIAFPNALWNISGTIGGTENPNGGAISASGNTTQVTIYTTSGQPGGTIMVIGIGN